MLDNQSRECSGKSYPEYTGYFSKHACKHISHSPLTTTHSPFLFFHRCRLLWPILHFLRGRLLANHIQPFLLLFSSSCFGEQESGESAQMCHIHIFLLGHVTLPSASFCCHQPQWTALQALHRPATAPRPPPWLCLVRAFSVQCFSYLTHFAPDLSSL